jgi:uncharacterized protein (DUF111 family)
MSVAETVTIPNIQLSLEQLLSVIPQLGPEARTELAKALLETELDARMAELMNSLIDRPAADDISDADIVAEVHAVRRPEHRSC